MSTLKVGTIQNASGVEVYTAKAWVNFNGTGKVPPSSPNQHRTPTWIKELFIKHLKQFGVKYEQRTKLGATDR